MVLPDVLLEVPGVLPPVKDCILMRSGHRGAAARGARSLSRCVRRRAKAKNHDVEITLGLDGDTVRWLKLRVQLRNWGWRWTDDNQVASIAGAQQVCTCAATGDWERGLRGRGITGGGVRGTTCRQKSPPKNGVHGWLKLCCHRCRWLMC